MNISINDPMIREFLNRWHEDGRKSFRERYPALDYDSPAYAKTAKDRSKYIALDDGTSWVFLLEKSTGHVYRIKAYGVPNRKKFLGYIDELAKGGVDISAFRWW